MTYRISERFIRPRENVALSHQTAFFTGEVSR